MSRGRKSFNGLSRKMCNRLADRLKESVKYPRTLFTTSTRDDRVHPGHARKMVAKMKNQGHNVVYYENIEGGHAGAADNKQAAFMQALAYAFLWNELTKKDNR
jgi:prolyl oligopeptidase